MTAFIDATPAANIVCRQVEKVLAQEVFRVQATEGPTVGANFDGMDLSDATLADASGIRSLPEAESWAAQHGIATDSLPDCLERVQRLAAAKSANPKLVNPELPQEVAARHWAILY